MAEGISNTQDLFTCSICLDILKDPVTLHCGHNYCMVCIKDCWDQDDQKGVYSCPQCRQTFTPRPVLNKNNVFAELVEQFRKTRIQVAAPVPPVICASAEDVKCDVCTGRKLKAVKSCLDCLLSYCETHFKAHNDVNPGRKHNVVDATGQLQERICTQHEKPLEIFCRTDQSCICFLCMVDEHKGHDTVSASAARKEKQTNFAEAQRKFKQRIQDREEKLQDMKKAVETLKSSAQSAVEDSERIFIEMIHFIERRRSEVTEMIIAQEKAEVSQAEGLLKKLEEEIAELKRRDAELEQLSHTEDHIHFLKTFQLLSNTPESKDLSCIYVNQTPSFEAVKNFVSTLKEQLENFCKKEVIKISSVVTKIHTILPWDPKTREEFLQYSCHFTLDPNTAHRELHLSEGNRRVERGSELQYPDHPERFDVNPQVLCEKSVSGRCYWEVECSGDIDIVISYKNIKRKGKDGGEFGCNDQSWGLRLTTGTSSFWHNSEEDKLPVVRSLDSSRIGVYVDHRTGTLAFYSISDTMTLLHQIQTTFTYPIYPGFWLSNTSSAQLL